jgi:hypothetical protein
MAPALSSYVAGRKRKSSGVNLMDQNDLAYLNGRAAQELQAAQQAGSAVAARPHYTMAMRYLEQAEELQRRLRSRAHA